MVQENIFDIGRKWLSSLFFRFFLRINNLEDTQYFAEIETDCLDRFPCSCFDCGDGLMKWNKDCPMCGEIRQSLDRQRKRRSL
jgi:hypothetical protein